MIEYQILFKRSVKKDLRKLAQTALDRIYERIEWLQSEPIPKNAQKLTGAENLYRIRCGDYRIIYSIDTDNHKIMIHYIRHRRDAYRSL